MIVLNTKGLEELNSDSTQELNKLGFSTKPGSIAKLFLNLVNKHVAEFYETLSVNHMRAFLSTSYGEALDSIGLLLQCKRKTEESDADYKYRISQQCYTLASSNEASIRLATLTIDGVDDVLLKPYAMGSGTFAVIVVTDPNYNQASVLKAVKDAVEHTVGYGINFKVDTPTLTPVKLQIRLNFEAGLSDTKKQEIRYKVKDALMEFFTTLAVGEDIMISKVTQCIMNCSTSITTYQTVRFVINQEKALFVNQSCRWFERFCISSDIDNVIVQ